jgi:hypothetical protein
VKVLITLAHGATYELVGIANPEDWARSFAVRGTSQLGDWVEVVPKGGAARTFVRAAQVVTVELVADGVSGEPAPAQP